jgi:hypothetical protein
MYIKPTLQRFGTFRELTQIGLTNNSDGASILSVNSPGSDRQWFGAGPSEDWERTLKNFESQTTS